MRFSLCLAILLAVMSSAAAADTSRDLAAIEARLKACIDKDGSNTGMQICTRDADGEADKVLNRVYGALVAGLKKSSDPEDTERNREILKRLVAAERAWIAYRDAECSFAGSEMLGGSGENLNIIGCTYGMTRERAKSLGERLQER